MMNSVGLGQSIQIKTLDTRIIRDYTIPVQLQFQTVGRGQLATGDKAASSMGTF